MTVLDSARRALMRKLLLGLSLAPLAARVGRAHADELPLLPVSDPTAKALDYVEDASQASAAQSGANCANCALYGGASGAAQGSCSLFPGKAVKAAGWCKSWSTL